MADDEAATTTATTVTFRNNHLVRLRGFDHAALDGKLVRIQSDVKEATSKFEVVFLDDQVRPPVPLVPARRMGIKPENMRHACEYCLVAAASAAVDGGRLQMCSRCKTARYCNAECQRADWARHKIGDCFQFSHVRAHSMSTFQQACTSGNVAEVRRLVEEEGADVDRATTNGPTPLAMAALCGHLSVVRYLVEYGADVDKARGTSFTPLYGAAQNNQLTVVQYLVEQGVDKDKAANDGCTPLYVAAGQGLKAMVQYLVEQGADKDMAMNKGATPLYIAAQKGHLAVVRYLVEQGADMDQAAEDNWTPLLIAAQEGYMAVVQYLMEQGADIDKAIDTGHPAVELGKVEGDGALAAYLSAAGYSEENGTCVNGATPLWAAAWQGHSQVVQYLVEHGADIDKPTSAGTTPLMVAEAAGYAEVAAYLRAAGAK